MFSNINGVSLIVPSSFSGILPVSPHPEIFEYETFAFSGIQKVVKPGEVVFDLGVSYGVMSALMANLVGENGKVYSFEANEDVFPYQNDLVKANRFENRVTFHHFLIGDKSGHEEEFYVVPSYQSVASTRNSEILKFHQDAKRTKVETLAIDDFCDRAGVIPNSIKIDIEGAEYVAIKGMERVIRSHHPNLIIETHGTEINGIGGNLKELVFHLEELGYSLFDLNLNRLTNAEHYVGLYSDAIGNLLCTRA